MTRVPALMVLMIGLLLPSPLAAQAPASSVPAPEGESLTALVEEVRARHGVPALGGAVVADGRAVRLGVAGVRRRGEANAVTLEDRWHLGSCTKAMTATLCARLVEKGLLRFETTLEEGTAGSGIEIPAHFRGVTLTELLRMRGGFPRDPNLRKVFERSDPPVAQRLGFLRGLMTLPAPKTTPPPFEYSNASYALAGLMAERAAKKDFETLLREELFVPLGMGSAGFGAPVDRTPGDQAVGHRGKDGAIPAPQGDAGDNPAAIAPAGRVHATLEDWAKFIALHLDAAAGKPRLLSAASFERLHARTEGSDYAMGWVLAERPWADGLVLTHTGSNTMWYAVAWLAPKKGFAVLAVTNQAGDAGPKATDALASELIQHWRRAPVPGPGK